MSYDLLADDDVFGDDHGPLVPTNVPLVDKLLGGGVESRGVYGLLGPYGSCKTTLGIMLAVEAARRLHQAEGDAGRSIVVLVSYEQTVAELRGRALSYVTGIPTRSITHIDSAADCSAPVVRREQTAFLRRLLIISDFDADKETKRQLRKGITGIASLIEQLRQARKCGIGLVIVDYVGAIAALRDLDEVRTSQLVESAGSDARRSIALPNECPVWLIHQLNGSANQSAKRGYLVKREQADGGRKFTDSLDGVICLGQPNAEQWLTVQSYVQRTFCKNACFAQLRADICLVEYAGEERTIRRHAGSMKDDERPDRNAPRSLNDDDFFD